MLTHLSTRGKRIAKAGQFYISNVGWQSWVTSGKTAGTTGKSLAIEAMQIKLSGGMENYFDIYYRMHVANRG